MSSSQPEVPTAQPPTTNSDDDDSDEETSSLPSGFARFESEFQNLFNLVSEIQKAFESPTTNHCSSTATDDVNNTTTTSHASTAINSDVNNSTTNSDAAITTTTTTNATTTYGITNSDAADATTNSNGNNGGDKNQLTVLEQDAKHIVKNVEYVKKNIKFLQDCSNGDRADELLQYLMDAAKNQSADDFEVHTENLHHLLQIVSKLKHWVPPQRAEESGNAKKKKNSNKKKESPIVSKKDKENAATEIVKTLVGYKCEEWGMDGLLKSYRELDNRAKLCLLCFSVFPCDVEKVKRKGNKDKDETTVRTDQIKDEEEKTLKTDQIKDEEEKTLKTDQSKDEDENTVKMDQSKDEEEKTLKTDQSKDEDEKTLKTDQNKDEEERPMLVQRNLVIKKKILIYWWVGEGFIDLPPKVIVDPACSKSSAKPDPNQPNLQSLNVDPQGTPDTNTSTTLTLAPVPSSNSCLGQNLGKTSISTPNPLSHPNPNAIVRADVGGGINEANWISPRIVEERETIEKTGEQILQVLKEKGFIEPVMKRGRKSGSYQMHPFVHSFVTALAKRAGFFDFREEDGKLTARFVQSHRACLLKSQGDSWSSCKVWKEYIDNRNKLKKFAIVQTLFNVNEPIIDISPEWFTKMKYLSVLHLGSWRSEAADHIEVEDPKFMEDLKGMKQLKLFSLQGVSTIMKLPDSVCKLNNLIILDLRECHNLEELPADIGSLKNLTHLDITNCHLLTKLPKGISLLSKLEVLNGFVIYNQPGDCEEQTVCILNQWWKKTKRCVVHDLFRCKNKELCTLRDLLMLVNLRELSLVVNRDNFPNPKEVQVFKKMRGLRSLKISWEKSFEDANSNQAGASQEPPTNCGWCFPGNSPGTENANGGVGQEVPDPNGHPSQNDTNEKSGGECLDQIIKLELWCCPSESAPNWLVPNELKSLEKLYIKGGNIKCLGKDGDKWNVETLRLKYLCNLEIDWRKLIEMFPRMTYLEKYKCKRLGLFPCDHEGVWKKKGS